MPEEWLAFHDETDELRELHEAHFTFVLEGKGGIRIEGGKDIFHLDTGRVRAEMSWRGVRRWSVRFSNEMEFDAFCEQYKFRSERHPVTGRYGRWLNPMGRWDWWDLGGRFDGCIIGDRPPPAGRGTSHVTSGDSPGRAILARIGDVLADALGQEPFAEIDLQADRNVEMVATLLEDARVGRDNAFPSSLVLPPGSIADEFRWMRTWPKMEPKEAVAWLGLSPDVSWETVVTAVYARFPEHWAAAIAYHH